MRFCAITVRRCVNCARVWWREEREKRKGHYWRLYALSESEAQEKLEAQDGKCVVCERAIFFSKSPRAQLDHCHDSGYPRDFLCARCNRGIGVFGDDHRLLGQAAKYLATHELRLNLNVTLLKSQPSKYQRPRHSRSLKGVPVRPRKRHHVLTPGGRRVDLSNWEELRELMQTDPEVAATVNAFLDHRLEQGRIRGSRK